MSNNDIETAKLAFESKLVPIMREGVDLIKMIFFKKIQPIISEKFPDKDRQFILRLAGAVINELFGALPDDPQLRSFRDANVTVIDDLLTLVPQRLPELQIPLTDALRMTVLCDFQEGTDSSHLLTAAQNSRILLADRDMVMPNHFIELVRRLGKRFNLIIPPPSQEPTEIH